MICEQAIQLWKVLHVEFVMYIDILHEKFALRLSFSNDTNIFLHCIDIYVA